MSNAATQAEATRRHITVLARRDLMLRGAAAAAALALLPPQAHAQDKGSLDFDAALKKLVGEAKPIEGKLTLEIPEIAENGNTVPYALSIDSPMTDADHVKRIHLLSTANPQPGVASFNFTPQSGRAFVSARMRLARTQDVVAVAEMSDGRVLLSRRTVKVTIGGCGG